MTWWCLWSSSQVPVFSFQHPHCSLFPLLTNFLASYNSVVYKSNINSDGAHAPNNKHEGLCSGLFFSLAGVTIYPQNSVWKRGAHRDDTGVFQGPSPCQKDGESPAPESTENSLEPDSCFLSKCCDINTIHHRQSFWAGSRCGSSPRESPGVNSSPWPPSPASLVRRSKCSWLFSSGMEGGVDFRNQLSSQPWTQGTKTPSPTSPHAQELQAGGIWTHEKPSRFSQIPFRAEQDARMTELEGLQRKLARIRERGCKALVLYCPK